MSTGWLACCLAPNQAPTRLLGLTPVSISLQQGQRLGPSGWRAVAVEPGAGGQQDRGRGLRALPGAAAALARRSDIMSQYYVTVTAPVINITAPDASAMHTVVF